MGLTLGLGLFAPPGKVLKTEYTHGASSSRPTMIIQAGLEAWKEACSALEDAARGDESPENLCGLAVVQWWLGEIQESERCFEQKRSTCCSPPRRVLSATVRAEPRCSSIVKRSTGWIRL